MMVPKRCLLKACALSLALVCAACQPPAPAQTAAASAAVSASGFYGSDVRTEGLGGDFTLVGHHGQNVSLADFRGKAVVLVFGYTHCPDVCPTHLVTYAEALAQLGEAASEVQLLFVTVDPERDTPALLAQYVPVFHADFIGLTADAADTALLNQVKRQYRIASEKVPHPSGHYSVDHSTGTYLLDRTGAVAVYEPNGQTATELAHDLRVLLGQ
ncbi:protein SCO1/2 [Neisseria sp. HSC-16F19]|nr:SCO family protein [Neisseria sp. HSC-16F19]MCP2040966.1 protein SCO1/2 [Neisseria sp. HSC-16F19]